MRPADAARGYIERGWHILPCHDLSTGTCSCRLPDCASPGKHPRVPRGVHAATTNAEVVARWWARWPTSNVGVRTGVESNLVVLDIDPRHGGTRSIKGLIDRHGDLRGVPRVRTGAGGWHLYFAHPGTAVRNSAGRLGAGLDVRGDGGYVVAPPSGHASGYRYRWEIDPATLPPLPGWLREEASPERARAASPDPRRDVAASASRSGWAQAALANELRAVRTSQPGRRNTTLNRSAYALGQIVGAGLLDAATVERLLVESGLRVGLREREAITTTRSGLRAGLAHPRGPEASLDGRSADHHAEAMEIGLP
jgi:hypothetical protein